MNTARVTVARIDSPLSSSLDQGLGTALNAGWPVERYNRTWRLELGQEIIEAIRRGLALPRRIPGRLGFDKTTGIAPAWDDSEKRFVARSQHDGDVVPFLLRTSDLTVAFQRTSKIRRQSFIGALQLILRDSSDNDAWSVRDLTTDRSWEEFRATAAVVTEVTITVMPTNPGWDGQELFEPYIDEMGGQRARITVTGEELDLDSSPIQQAMTHALENEYGELKANGRTDSGETVRFDSDEPVPALDEVAERTPDGEVGYESLAQVLDEFDEEDKSR